MRGLFSVYLPVDESFFKAPLPQPKEPVWGGTETILLVDDEESIIRMESLLLQRLGYHVRACTGSMEALEIFRSAPEKVDLVITDFAMPDMPGDKLAAKFIDIRSDIPILLCTGFSETMPEEKATALGIKGYLMKPFGKTKLAAKIRDVLDNQQMERR